MTRGSKEKVTDVLGGKRKHHVTPIMVHQSGGEQNSTGQLLLGRRGENDSHPKRKGRKRSLEEAGRKIRKAKKKKGGEEP